jgi:hypothetical protein
MFFVLSFALSHAQPKRIQFSYDTAGNQIQRMICMPCDARVANDTIATIKTPETLTESDLIRDNLYKQISYYPNPVRQELYVKWVNEKANFVTEIELYSMSGQSVKKYKNLNQTDMATIAFQDYPQGFYNLVLVYSDGEKKTLKIVKQ